MLLISALSGHFGMKRSPDPFAHLAVAGWMGMNWAEQYCGSIHSAPSMLIDKIYTEFEENQRIIYLSYYMYISND